MAVLKMPLSVKISLLSNIVACFLLSVSMGMTAALLPVVLTSKGYGESLIGVLLTFETLAAFAICFALPFVLKVFKMRIGLILTTIFRLLPFAFLVIFFSSTNTVLWACIIFLIATGSYGYLLLSQTWVNALPIQGNFGLWMAVYSTSMSIGIACGPFVLNALNEYGYLFEPLLNEFNQLLAQFIPKQNESAELVAPNRELDQLKFFVAFIFSIIASVPLILTVRFAPKFKVEGKISIIKSILDSKGPMFAIALAGVSFFGVSAFITVYGILNGLPEARAILLLSAFNLGSILLEVPLGWLSDRVDRRFVVVLCSLLCATCAAFLPLAIGEFPIALGLVFIWGGVIGAIYSLALALIGDKFTGEDLIAANAGYSVMEGLGGTFGILLIGFAIEFFSSDGLPYVIMFSSVLFISFALTRYKVI